MSQPMERFLNSQRYTYYLICILKPPFLSDDSPQVLHQFWEFLSWFSVFLPLHMTVCYLKTVIDNNGDYDLLTYVNFSMESVWFFFSFLGQVHYKFNQKTLVKLLEEIETNYKWRSPKGRTYVDIEKAYKYAKYVSLFWQFFAPVFVFASVVLAVLMRNSEPQPWYPLNQDNPILFIVSSILKGWAKMIMVFNFSSGSCLFVSFCFLTCGQFNILRCSLKNLVYTSGIYQRFEETQVRFTKDDVQPGEYTLSVEREDDDFILDAAKPEGTSVLSKRLNLTSDEVEKYRNALNNCIEHHHLIVAICGKMEAFFNRFAFYRVAEMTLQICFLAYMYPKTNTIIPFAYFLMTFFDIFLLTYPPQHVQWHNESIGGAILWGPWHLVAKYFYRDFIIIMSQSCRPIRFTASKILTLDVSCLKGVITTAFSYYTLLTKFDN